jgi:hypothetical protein
MFVKTSLKPYMFRSLLYDHPQGSSFVLSALPLLRLNLMFVDPCIIIRSINNQLDAVFSFFLYFCYTLYMFRVPFAPIIRSILKTVHAAW